MFSSSNVTSVVGLRPISVSSASSAYSMPSKPPFWITSFAPAIDPPLAPPLRSASPACETCFGAPRGGLGREAARQGRAAPPAGGRRGVGLGEARGVADHRPAPADLGLRHHALVARRDALRLGEPPAARAEIDVEQVDLAVDRLDRA